MIKGCRKNVVYVRNTDSELFHEAYFILSDDFETEKQPSEPDMVAEANRIIAQSPIAAYFGVTAERRKKKCRGKAAAVSRALWFMAGALFSSAVALMISVL